MGLCHQVASLQVICVAVDWIYPPCSVRDSDGEFMLIEAADDLPSWVTPSVVENRVRTVLKSCLCTGSPKTALVGLDLQISPSSHSALICIPAF